MKTSLRPKFITDRKGNKRSVIITLQDYNKFVETLGDLEDANDLLEAEREASGFIPYEIFLKKYLIGKKS